jgi:hypothetical protein
MGMRLSKAKLGFDTTDGLDAVQPLGRACRREDVAQTVRCLVSTDASLITGQRI